MKRSVGLFLIMVISVGQAKAMEGTFDRSAEVAKYIDQINNTPTQKEMIEVAKPIYVSGISDEKLAQALGERLLKDLPIIDSSRTESQYGMWMVKALSSTGTEYARQTIDIVRHKTHVHRLIGTCNNTLTQIDWERHKNEIMASRKNFSEGGNMRVAQLLNLLQDPNFSYKENGAFRMSWEKMLDPSLMEEIAKQLQAFVDKKGISGGPAENSVMGNFAKLLGYSKDEKYRPLLLALYKSDAATAVKSQANKAIHNL